MKTYYVVGYYPDTNQRFADEIEARSHKAAESEFAGHHGLVVVASFCLDEDNRPKFDNETHTK